MLQQYVDYLLHARKYIGFSHYCSSPRIHWPVPFSHIYIITHLSEPHRMLTSGLVNMFISQRSLDNSNSHFLSIAMFNSVNFSALLGSMSLISMDCMTQALNLWFPIRLGPWEPSTNQRQEEREGGFLFCSPPASV